MQGSVLHRHSFSSTLRLSGGYEAFFSAPYGPIGFIEITPHLRLADTKSGPEKNIYAGR